MVEYFEFEVGEEEFHRVQYYYEYGGYFNVILVDGEMIGGSRSLITEDLGEGIMNLIISKRYPNLKKGNEIHLEIGDREKHDLRIIFTKKGNFGLEKEVGVQIEVDGDIVKDIEKEKYLNELEL